MGKIFFPFSLFIHIIGGELIFITMKKSKFISSYLLLVAVIGTLALSGCREKTPEETVKRYDGVELTYYKVFDDSEIIEPIIREFETSHPGLKIHYKKFSDFDEYMNVILNEMAEGEGPDIFSMQNTWFASNRKKIAPLPQEYGTPANFADTFVDTAYQDLVLPDDNGVEQVYGVPMTVDTLALYYNKDHFEDRLPEKGKPSTTWQGIKEDVIALNKEDNSFDRFEVSGIAMGRSDNISRSVDILYLLFLQYGVEFYNENISEAIFAGQQNADVSYPGLKALDFYISFADPAQKHFSWNELVVDDDSEGMEIEAFAEGKVSMIIGYSYTYDYILDYIDLLDSRGLNTIDENAIRVAQIPQLHDPSVSTEKRVTYASYFAETVSRNSENQDLAWEFLVELTTRENLEYYFDKTHKPTSRRDMIEDQKKDPDYGIFVSQIGYAESFPVIDYNVYKEIFSDTINRANSGGINRSDLVLAQDLVNELLPEEGYLVPKVEVDES